jgi:hypothetical protein
VDQLELRLAALERHLTRARGARRIV